MTAVVTLENVSVRYLSAAEPAISDVSLCVEPGELLLLAGPSGCGKSTVMRVVNGLVPNAYRADIGGSVTVGGQDAKELTIRQISETVGTLLQNPGRQVVEPWVLADIAFGLENRAVRLATSWPASTAWPADWVSTRACCRPALQRRRRRHYLSRQACARADRLPRA